MFGFLNSLYPIIAVAVDHKILYLKRVPKSVKRFSEKMRVKTNNWSGSRPRFNGNRSIAALHPDAYYQASTFKPETLQMTKVVLLISLAVLSGCGAGKAAMDAGKGFDRFACASRNFKGEPPCPQPDNPNQTP